LEAQANEDLDEMKTINNLIVTAEARTGRDVQLEEGATARARRVERA